MPIDPKSNLGPGAGAGAASGGGAAGGIVAELTGDGRFSSGHQLNAGSARRWPMGSGHCDAKLTIEGTRFP